MPLFWRNEKEKEGIHTRPAFNSRGALFLYLVGLLFAILLCAGVYRAYFRNYEYLHPEITWALPWVQEDLFDAKAVLLWKETLLVAPISGRVHFLTGKGPVRVAKGEQIATVGGVRISAPASGYFLAGIDGLENSWHYSSLWTSAKGSFTPKPLHWSSEGDNLPAGVPIGKLVLQPQELRCIVFLPPDEGIYKNLKSGFLNLKLDPLDTPSQATVRVYESQGREIKAYLSLPWFPPGVVTSRFASLKMVTGERSGVMIPSTALTFFDGKWGVFVVRGNESVFREVSGSKLSNGGFLVTSGLKAGDAVITDGSKAHEGRVQLW